MAVPRTTHSFTLTGLSSMLDYDVTISALCVYSGLRSEGEKVSFQLTTLPERVRTLQLEHASTNAITVKWDYPLVSQNIRLDNLFNSNLDLFLYLLSKRLKGFVADSVVNCALFVTRDLFVRCDLVVNYDLVVIVLTQLLLFTSLTY